MKKPHKNECSDDNIIPIKTYPEDYAREKKEYRKMLKELCPSKTLRKQAKIIASTDDPCDCCAYYDEIVGGCDMPYTREEILDLNIDPCYEGVLTSLGKDAAMQKKRHKATVKGIEDLLEALEITSNKIYYDDEMIRMLSAFIIRMSDDGLVLPFYVLDSIRKLNEYLTELREKQYCN